MKKTLIAATLAGAFLIPATSVMAEDAAPAAAPASPLTFNVGVVSDYIFRGISQTHGDPAIQGGIDYAFSNGFYIGTWASNVSWVKNWVGKGSVELDIYGGLRNSFAGGDWNYDVGVITYNYPGHGDSNAGLANPNTTEVYGALGYKWVSVKYSRTESSHFVGWYDPANGGNTDGSGYAEVNASYDLGGGWGIAAHAGHQKVEHRPTASYTDWKLGVTKDVGFGVVGLAYTSTNAQGKCSAGQDYCWGKNTNAAGFPTTNLKDVSKDKLLLTFLKTF